MVAYVIGIRHKTLDQAEMDAYAAEVGATIPDTARVLALYGAHEDVESTPIEGIAMSEFPTMQDVQNWYHSPEYQKIKEHRLKGGKYTLLIFDGV